MRWLTILASFLAIAVTAAAQSARAPEYEVKAAFLYNFAKFVEWPPQAFAYSSTPIRFCVLGDDAFADTLSNTIQGKSVSGRPIVNSRLQAPAQARSCHVLFVSPAVPEAVKLALESIRNLPVLTVSESADFLRLGGMINFVLEQDRVRFEINLEAAERHHLKLSSKLLAVARVVDVGGGPN